MELLSVVLVILTAALSKSSAQVGYSSETCSTIRLLSVIPYPDNGTFAGWDRGFEMIPAGYLATKHINQIPDILPGHQLEVINVFSESCGRSTTFDGLVEVFKWLVPPHDACVFGVVGLYCSIVTNTIAPVVDRANFGHIVLAASTSPTHRDTSALPHTFHTIASSSIFNEALIALMNEFQWEKISVVQDVSSFFFTSITEHFEDMTKANSKTIKAKISILQHKESITDTFDTINAEEARISYLSITMYETAAFFCEAFRRRFLWPGYIYAVHEFSLALIISASRSVDCSQEEMVEALEGVFSLQYKLVPSDRSADLVSRMSYEQYHSQYTEELSKFTQKTMLTDSIYANSLYDQVWAFALAANMSPGNTTFYNRSTASPEESAEEMLRTRDILTRTLKDVEFQGASGFIKFGSNQEVETIVDIFQVINGEEMLVAYYNPFNRSIIFQPDFEKEKIPGDSFELYYRHVSVWVGIVVAISDVSIFLLITFVVIYVILQRNAPEIKSSSFPLSLLMLVGCYSLCISTVTQTIRVVAQITNPYIFIALCNLSIWLFLNGANIILVTLAVRLLRIFHVFHSYRSTSKHWSDKYLITYITFICSAMLFLLVLWTTLDPFSLLQVREYDPSATPPHYTVHNSCSSQHLGTWVALSSCLLGMAMIFVIFLAIQTRHIKRKHFKDTKKVNAFILSTCLVCGIFLPMWLILISIGSDTGSFVTLCIVQLSGAALCLIFLFMPKVIPSLRRKVEQ